MVNSNDSEGMQQEREFVTYIHKKQIALGSQDLGILIVIRDWYNIRSRKIEDSTLWEGINVLLSSCKNLNRYFFPLFCYVVVCWCTYHGSCYTWHPHVRCYSVE